MCTLNCAQNTRFMNICEQLCTRHCWRGTLEHRMAHTTLFQGAHADRTEGRCAQEIVHTILLKGISAHRHVHTTLFERTCTHKIAHTTLFQGTCSFEQGRMRNSVYTCSFELCRVHSSVCKCSFKLGSPSLCACTMPWVSGALVCSTCFCVLCHVFKACSSFT